MSSLITRIIRTSAVWALVLLLPTGHSFAGVDLTQGTPASAHAITAPLAAYIAEQSFWMGIVLPQKQVTVIIFVSDEPASTSRSEVLAIVPDLNVTLKSQLCGQTLIPEGGSVGWLGWSDSTATKLPPDEYLTKQVTQYSNFVAHAQRTESVLTIESDPADIFRIEKGLKIRRISEIRRSAEQFFHKRPLHLQISNFSEFTNQINVLIPEINEMVTFSVVPTCSGGETVQVGRELPLSSIRSNLRQAIDSHSTAAVIK